MKYLYLLGAMLFVVQLVDLIKDYIDFLSEHTFDIYRFIQFIIVVILYLVIAYLFANHFAAARRREKLQKTLPIRTDYAKVISKHIDVTGRYLDTRFYVAFVLMSGERKQFEVTNEQYPFLIEGEKGKLYYKEGKGFAFFEYFEVIQRNTNY